MRGSGAALPALCLYLYVEGVVKAVGVPDRKDTDRWGNPKRWILRLEDGRVAFPVDFEPEPWREYLVEVVHDGGRWARVRLHRHSYVKEGEGEEWDPRTWFYRYEARYRCAACGEKKVVSAMFNPWLERVEHSPDAPREKVERALQLEREWHRAVEEVAALLLREEAETIKKILELWARAREVERRGEAAAERVASEFRRYYFRDGHIYCFCGDGRVKRDDGKTFSAMTIGGCIEGDRDQCVAMTISGYELRSRDGEVVELSIHDRLYAYVFGAVAEPYRRGAEALRREAEALLSRLVKKAEETGAPDTAVMAALDRVLPTTSAKI
jgi:hypothetical protein